MSDQNLMQLMIADPALPWQHRYGMLRDLLNNLNAQTEPIVKSILEGVGQRSGESVYAEKIKKLDGMHYWDV